MYLKYFRDLGKSLFGTAAAFARSHRNEDRKAEIKGPRVDLCFIALNHAPFLELSQAFEHSGRSKAYLPGYFGIRNSSVVLNYR